MLLLLVVLITVSCKDEKMFGSLVVTLNVPATTNPKVGLFDIASLPGESEALYEVDVIIGRANFPELNPGNYRAVLIGTTYSHAVQVKVGQQALVTIY